MRIDSAVQLLSKVESIRGVRLLIGEDRNRTMFLFIVLMNQRYNKKYKVMKATLVMTKLKMMSETIFLKITKKNILVSEKCETSKTFPIKRSVKLLSNNEREMQLET